MSVWRWWCVWINNIQQTLTPVMELWTRLTSQDPQKDWWVKVTHSSVRVFSSVLASWNFSCRLLSILFFKSLFSLKKMKSESLRRRYFEEHSTSHSNKWRKNTERFWSSQNIFCVHEGEDDRFNEVQWCWLTSHTDLWVSSAGYSDTPPPRPTASQPAADEDKPNMSVCDCVHTNLPKIKPKPLECG